MHVRLKLLSIQKLKLVFSLFPIFTFFVHASEKSDYEGISAFNYRFNEELKAAENPFGLALYNQNYFLPLNYNFHSHSKSVTQRPDPSVKMRNMEFRAQLSLGMRLIDSIFDKESLSFHMAFTQLYFWQLYSNSAFFRETNYRPEFFLKWDVNRNLQTDFGLSHESNGQGGLQERSQNKAYVHFIYHNNGLVLKVHFWSFILQGVSSNKYNPDIEKYLGNLEASIHYKFKNDIIFNISLRNFIESHGQLSSLHSSLSYPLNKRFRVLGLFFSGYGVSLIEYNKNATSLGIGLALNDFL